jgi:hypothetical protein
MSIITLGPGDTVTIHASHPPGYQPPWPVDPGFGNPGQRPPIDPGFGNPAFPVGPGWGNRPVDPGFGNPIFRPPVDPEWGVDPKPPTTLPPIDKLPGNWTWAWAPQEGRWVWVRVPGSGEAGPKTTTEPTPTPV